MGEKYEFPATNSAGVESFKSPNNEANIFRNNLADMFNILSSLRISKPQLFDETNIDRRRQEIRGYSDDLLINWVNKHAEHDVEAHGCFYTAIYDEIKSRNLD